MPSSKQFEDRIDDAIFPFDPGFPRDGISFWVAISFKFRLNVTVRVAGRFR